MNLMRKLAVVIVALASLSVAEADLIDRGSGLIYDGDLDITWTQNANMNGAMSWAAGAANMANALAAKSSVITPAFHNSHT